MIQFSQIAIILSKKFQSEADLKSRRALTASNFSKFESLI